MASKAFPNDQDNPTYERDFAAWAFHQAMLLRAGQLHLLDRTWIAEELETLGRGEFRRLRSALALVLEHMLKWDHQSERRSRSWVGTILRERRTISQQFEENPSLKPRRDEAVELAYHDAVIDAAAATKIDPKDFPERCPFDWADIMTREFDWPAA